MPEPLPPYTVAELSRELKMQGYILQSYMKRLLDRSAQLLARHNMASGKMRSPMERILAAGYAGFAMMKVPQDTTGKFSGQLLYTDGGVDEDMCLKETYHDMYKLMIDLADLAEYLTGQRNGNR